MTTFMMALTSFQMKAYDDCRSKLNRLTDLEVQWTARGGRPISVPLELAGDAFQAEGRFEEAKLYFKKALNAKRYQKECFSHEQEQRLIEKLANTTVDVRPFEATEYISEYTLALSYEEYHDPLAPVD